MTDSERDDTCREKNTRKRKITGRINEVMKRLRQQSHETGDDCQCKRLKCFKTVDQQNRSNIINNFNRMGRDEQNIYLAGLITLMPVKQRRARDEATSRLHDATYSFRVRITTDDKTTDVPVCFKAFLSLHGIGRKRLENIQKSLKATGSAPIDKRGKNPKKHALTKQQLDEVIEHIKRFKGRESHYSKNKTKKMYLPDDLNIKKMYTMYKSDKGAPLSYETYRQIFNKHFNISFGYPRSDTCNACDHFLAELKVLHNKLNETIDASEKQKIEVEIKRITLSNSLHKSKAEAFYEIKRRARKAAMQNVNCEAVSMDFEKNLSTPNIPTNDVYYKRQLTLHSFNIHVLSTGNATFYCFPETIGGKGSNEVVSFLHHFIFVQLDLSVRHLHIFCDSCGGQNKNFTVFRYLHYVVNTAKRLDSIKVTFPIRGHSYMECDRDMGVINQKIMAELPEDWYTEIRSCRVKPNPFDVVEVDQSLIRNWLLFLDKIYVTKPTYKSRPIRELEILKDHPRLFKHRDSYNGQWETSIIRKPFTNSDEVQLPESQFILPPKLYTELRKISKEKFNDLVHLSQFCTSERARSFYRGLPYNKNNKNVNKMRRK
ncbi:uncharacterized protein [Diabrotica undecimpunctata]|uniref:uncharacterized protein n=2 Tax=Diabrotica undecimpunctata TaxID=50387 RepID=UPI003B63D1CD